MDSVLINIKRYVLATATGTTRLKSIECESAAERQAINRSDTKQNPEDGGSFGVICYP